MENHHFSMETHCQRSGRDPQRRPTRRKTRRPRPDLRQDDSESLKGWQFAMENHHLLMGKSPSFNGKITICGRYRRYRSGPSGCQTGRSSHAAVGLRPRAPANPQFGEEQSGTVRKRKRGREEKKEGRREKEKDRVYSPDSKPGMILQWYPLQT